MKLQDLVSFAPLIYKYQGESEPLHAPPGSPTGRCFSASVVRPFCRQIFPGQLRSAPDRSFSNFSSDSSHHARIGSSGHFPATDFFITILLGPYAFSPCRFFADFSVTCTSCRKWEFLHRPRLRSRPGNAPTPCRKSCTPSPNRKRQRRNACNLSTDQRQPRHRHTVKRSNRTPNSPGTIPGNDTKRRTRLQAAETIRRRLTALHGAVTP